LDIVDVTGVHIVNIAGFMQKRVLDETGAVIHFYDALKRDA